MEKMRSDKWLRLGGKYWDVPDTTGTSPPATS